ncbi:hypothetical protein ACIB24_01955 [Spongisporangium articulatum]|uniref:Transcriptional regulator, AbiEi antitoxin, Type IV TA system n=1 Tax=Spongisporangium articulatum TaxID=3362603 RepID=A0ABW8AHI8_9ACTN
MLRPCDRALGLASDQAGAVSASQLYAVGVTAKQVRVAVRARRWRRVLPGVFVVFTGPLPDLTRVWCALLYAGAGATASHGTALWLHDGAERGTPLPRPIELSVPHERKVKAPAGVVVHRRRKLPDSWGSPPRLRVEPTVLDLAEAAHGEDAALEPVLRAIQRRLTKASRLRTELGRRGRHRWRGLLTEVLAEENDGVTTPLELRYARDVERAHRLPKAERNRPEGANGRRRYRDNRYVEFGLVVELDGEEAHPRDDAHLDRRRDNAVTVMQQGTLRYGWREVTGLRCATADEVARALQHRGWTGRAHPCGLGCRLPGTWTRLG